jgi:hypothetical protein
VRIHPTRPQNSIDGVPFSHRCRLNLRATSCLNPGVGPTPVGGQQQWFIQHSTTSITHLDLGQFDSRLYGISGSNVALIHSSSLYVALAHSHPNHRCSTALGLSRSARLMHILALDDPDSARPKGNGSPIPSQRRSRNCVLCTWFGPEHASRCDFLQWV